MLTAHEVEALVLEFAGEDYFGLYEIIWRLNALYPAMPEAVKRAAAQPAVRALLQSGRLQLYRARWASPDAPVPLAPAEAEAVLHDENSWQPAEAYICFAAADR